MKLSLVIYVIKLCRVFIALSIYIMHVPSIYSVAVLIIKSNFLPIILSDVSNSIR
jgi:hypothetical protein